MPPLSSPTVSVIMAVYNGQPLLKEAVRSILGQTFEDFEFLVVDDGSTDGSGELLQSFEDPRIRVITNAGNRGLTASLNRAIEQARGDYVARQDADDFSHPTRLARQVGYLDAHPDTALLGTWYRKADGQNRFLGLRKLPIDHTRIRWSLLFFCPFAHTSVMFRRRLVLDRVVRTTTYWTRRTTSSGRESPTPCRWPTSPTTSSLSVSPPCR